MICAGASIPKHVLLSNHVYFFGYSRTGTQRRRHGENKQIARRRCSGTCVSFSLSLIPSRFFSSLTLLAEYHSLSLFSLCVFITHYHHHHQHLHHFLLDTGFPRAHHIPFHLHLFILSFSLTLPLIVLRFVEHRVFARTHNQV